MRGFAHGSLVKFDCTVAEEAKNINIDPQQSKTRKKSRYNFSEILNLGGMHVLENKIVLSYALRLGSKPA